MKRLIATMLLLSALAVPTASAVPPTVSIDLGMDTGLSVPVWYEDEDLQPTVTVGGALSFYWEYALIVGGSETFPVGAPFGDTEVPDPLPAVETSPDQTWRLKYTAYELLANGGDSTYAEQDFLIAPRAAQPTADFTYTTGDIDTMFFTVPFESTEDGTSGSEGGALSSAWSAETQIGAGSMFTFDPVGEGLVHGDPVDVQLIVTEATGTYGNLESEPEIKTLTLSYEPIFDTLDIDDGMGGHDFTVGSTANAVVTYIDPDEQGLVGISYQWLKDGNPIVGETGISITLDSGDGWTQSSILGLTATLDSLSAAEDGREPSKTINLPLTNALPEVAGLQVEVSSVAVTEAFTDDVLEVTFTTSDADGTTPIDSIQWQSWDGAAFVDIAGQTSATLPITETTKGDEIRAEVTSCDSLGCTEAHSASVDIINSVPEATIVLRTDGADVDGANPITKANSVGFVLSATDADAGDSPTISATQWTVNAVNAGTDATLPTTAFVRGDLVEVTVTFTDGTDSDSVMASATVANAEPSLSLAWQGTPDSDDATITVIGTTDDVDTDTVSLAYAWKKNNVATSETTATLTGPFADGDDVEVTVTATDGNGGSVTEVLDWEFGQVDTDGDGDLDADDNCPTVPNANQADLDNDDIGDACDDDRDGDGDSNTDETAAGSDPDDADSTINDRDGDGDSNTDETAAGSDPDDADSTIANLDGDNHLNVDDNCPTVANNNQADLDDDDIGDACDDDIDGDGDTNTEETTAGSDPEDADSTVDNLDGDDHDNTDDNCPLVANDDQADLDEDGEGDACDDDIDGDGILNDDDDDPRDATVGNTFEQPDGLTVKRDGDDVVLTAFLDAQTDRVSIFRDGEFIGTIDKADGECTNNICSFTIADGEDGEYAMKAMRASDNTADDDEFDATSPTATLKADEGADWQFPTLLGFFILVALGVLVFIGVVINARK